MEAGRPGAEGANIASLLFSHGLPVRPAPAAAAVPVMGFRATRPEALIVGGGIAGLAAAIGLARLGWC